MTALTIKEVSRRSRLSEPTLRYYEEIRLIGTIERDANSRHRRYREQDLDNLQALACLRAMGVGIEDMRTYQANRQRGHEAAGEQRDLLLRHAERIGAEIETLRIHLDYLRAKASLWDARDRGDACAETAADMQVHGLIPPSRRCCVEPCFGYRRVWVPGHAADRGAPAGRPFGAGNRSLSGGRGRCAGGDASRSSR
jgi:DNA-binding transcriptional MerR regulator